MTFIFLLKKIDNLNAYCVCLLTINNNKNDIFLYFFKYCSKYSA